MYKREWVLELSSKEEETVNFHMMIKICLMQFTVESNHTMDKNCFKFIPIALFSCRYKRKNYTPNAAAVTEFHYEFSAFHNTQNRKIINR